MGGFSAPAAPLLRRGAHGDSEAPEGRSGSLSTFQNLVKPFIGAGILALPRAFSEGGIVASSILMVFLAFLTTFCIHCLLDCTAEVNKKGWRPTANILVFQEQENEEIAPLMAVKNSPEFFSQEAAGRPEDGEILLPQGNNSSSASSTPRRGFCIPAQPSMRDIGFLAFGPWGTFMTDCGLIASQIGFCLAYTAFISENLNFLLPQLSRDGYILVLFLSWCFLCQIRDISYLAWSSAAGNFIYLFSLIIIFYDGFSHWNDNGNSPKENFSYLDLTGLPFVFGTASFALEGIGLILPVKRASKDPEKFPFLLHSAIFLVTCLYCFFGIICVLFYGDAVNPNITVNLTPGPWKSAVKATLSGSLYFSFLIQMFPVLEIMDSTVLTMRNRWIFPRKNSTDNSSSSDFPLENTGNAVNSRQSNRNSKENAQIFLFQIVGRVLCVLFPCFVAFVFPKFGLIVDLVGCVANSLIAFILPSLYYLAIIVWPRFLRDKRRRMREFQNDQDNGETAESFKANDEKIFSRWEFFLPGLVVVAGILASLTGLFYTIKKAVDGNAE